MAVAAEGSSLLDLPEASEALELQELPDAVKLGEVLLELGIRHIGQDLCHQRLERRAKLAHRAPIPRVPNIEATVRRAGSGNRDGDHSPGAIA